MKSLTACNLQQWIDGHRTCDQCGTVMPQPA